MTLSFRAVLTIALLFVTTAQASDALFLTQQEQTWLRTHPAPLRVHNEMSWKPYNYNENGTPKGYSIDYMNLLAKKLNVEISYISGPTWRDFLNMMREGSLDVMVNIANTRDRRKYLRFTDPYHITTVGLYVKSSESTVSDLDSLAGKKLGFIDGFFFGEFLRRYYPDIKLITFPTAEASFIGIRNGVVDAAMEVPLVARHILRDTAMTDIKFAGKVSDPVFITTFSIATAKDNVVLHTILQKAVDSVTPQEMQAINEKWALNENHITQLSEDDLTYLQKLGGLRVCVNPSRLPLEALNLDGSLTGISSEFLDLLSSRMSIPLTVVATQNWGESLEYARQSKCDILPMAAKNASTRADLNFTSPWLSLEQVIVTRNDQIYISDIGRLSHRRFGVVRGEPSKEALLATHPDMQLVEVDSTEEGLKQVEQGELFGFIDTLATISRVLQTEQMDNVKISGSVGVTADYTIGVRSDDGHLLGILERAISTIHPTDINAIYNRWLAVAYVERADYSRFWQALAVLSLLTAYIFYRYRKGTHVAAALKAAHAEVEAANRELDLLARTDSLTGLANRLQTDDILRQEFARFERYGDIFSIIMLDIDHFKKINDQHGHEAGDQVLKRIAGVLSSQTRESDIVGRWGGEEFLIVCPSSDAEGAMRLAQTLRKEIADVEISGLTSQSASFGVATIQLNETINGLMRRADEVLYQAKAEGRNRVHAAT